MNLLKTLATLTPSNILLFEALVATRSVETNVVERADLLAVPNINPRFVQNHMPGLVASNLVRRIARGRYLINPVAVMPPNGSAARAMWSDLSCVAELSENATAATPVTG